MSACDPSDRYTVRLHPCKRQAEPQGRAFVFLPGHALVHIAHARWRMMPRRYIWRPHFAPVRAIRRLHWSARLLSAKCLCALLLALATQTSSAQTCHALSFFLLLSPLSNLLRLHLAARAHHFPHKPYLSAPNQTASWIVCNFHFCNAGFCSTTGNPSFQSCKPHCYAGKCNLRHAVSRCVALCIFREDPPATCNPETAPAAPGTGAHQ